MMRYGFVGWLVGWLRVWVWLWLGDDSGLIMMSGWLRTRTKEIRIVLSRNQPQRVLIT